MSTNYYFVNIKSIEATIQFNKELYRIMGTMEAQFQQLHLSYTDYHKVMDSMSNLLREPQQLHIGKRSAGWKPLFQLQQEYTSITGMREWFEAHSTEWIIMDECDKKMTWEELDSELIQFNANNPDALSHMEHPYDYRLIDGHEWLNGEFS